MKKVCLVIPPSVFLLDERVFVSLGVLKVVAVLERDGHEVEVVDLSGVENYVEVLALHAAASDATIYGITATTPQLPAALAIVDRLREVGRPGVRAILGGPHATLVNAAVKVEERAHRISRAHSALVHLRQRFDVIVAGDGERAALQAIAEDAPWLIDADAKSGGLFMSDAEYEETPWPARHLVDMASYHYTIEGFPATSLIAQLGCPFGCGFCGGRSSRMLRTIRTRSTASIVAELEHLHATYGYTGFMFYDDELNVSRTMVELMRAVTALQDRLGVAFRLRGFVKAELFTAEQAGAMYAAGFRWILCGFEAAHPRILKNIEKRATLDDNNRAMEYARAAGLKVKALMSIGHPGETLETVNAVEDWLIAVQPDDFDCTVITCYPGTPYYDQAVPHASIERAWTYTAKGGDRLHSFDIDFTTTAGYYKGAPGGGYEAYVFTDELSSAQIVTLRDNLEARVRAKLGIPWNVGHAATRYEHSMGQGLPLSILRSTADCR